MITKKINSKKIGSLGTQPRTSELVLNKLRDAIIDGTLVPNEQLKTTDLAEEMGVSRTPVREALFRLEDEGLVVTQPYRGAIVAPMSVEGVLGAYELLSVIEGLAGRKAAETIDDQDLEDLENILTEMQEALDRQEYGVYYDCNYRFHSEISSWYQNEKAQEILHQLWNYTQRLRQQYPSSPRRFANAMKEHRAMLAALRRHDGQQVESLLRQHGEDSVSELMRRIQNKPVSRETVVAT
ncbi:MAG: GntR family transcriptional regulator [Chloroflexota bacterium]|nr:GntR family transcriptional regulator [Chloroflexota bacterium]